MNSKKIAKMTKNPKKRAIIPTNLKKIVKIVKIRKNSQNP